MRLRVPRRAALTLAAVLPLGLASIFLSASAPAANAAAVAQIQNVFTGTCLSAWNWYNGSGNRVTLGTCSAKNYNSWIVEDYSGYVRVVLAYHDNMCLDGVLGTGGVTVKPCLVGDLHQRWIEEKPFSYSFIRTMMNNYLDYYLDGTIDYGVRCMPAPPGGAGTDSHQWWVGAN